METWFYDGVCVTLKLWQCPVYFILWKKNSLSISLNISFSFQQKKRSHLWSYFYCTFIVFCLDVVWVWSNDDRFCIFGQTVLLSSSALHCFTSVTASAETQLLFPEGKWLWYGPRVSWSSSHCLSGQRVLDSWSMQQKLFPQGPAKEK